MRIRLWNAFASNNSGSYTIVGTFPDAASAARMAAELAGLCRDETAWRARAEHRPEDQPLLSIAREIGANPDEVGGDDWPDMVYAKAPQIAHVAHQVVLHVPYTVTMPRLLGQLLYHRGGRVDVELNHAHDPLVVDHNIYGRWDDGSREQRLAAVFAALAAADAPFRQSTKSSEMPVLQHLQGAWPQVRLVAVYDDLVAGVAAVDRAVREHGVEQRVRILEGTPDAPLRPWRSP